MVMMGLLMPFHYAWVQIFVGLNFRRNLFSDIQNLNKMAFNSHVCSGGFIRLLFPGSKNMRSICRLYIITMHISSFQQSMLRMEKGGLAIKQHNLDSTTFLKVSITGGIWLIVYHQRETKSEHKNTLETNPFFLCGVSINESNEYFVVL